MSANMISGDFDEEGLSAFNEIAKETMKIERLVIQQQELSSKLEELLTKTQSKLEKERDRHKHLKSDIQSSAVKHNLYKENLQGKTSKRHMVEQMTADLERQLQLEQNNIHNKATAFQQTERNYSEMWSNYEAVYLGSEEAQCMIELKAVHESALQHLEQLGQVNQSLKNEYKTKIRQQGNKRNTLVLQLVELTKELQKSKFEKEAEEQEFKSANQELTSEKNNVKTLQDKLAAGVAPDVTKGQVTEESNDQTTLSYRDRLKNIFQFDALTLPILKLPDWDLMRPNESQEYEDFGTNYQGDMNDDIEQMDINPYIVANRDVPSQNPTQLQAEVTPEVMNTQESATEEPQEEPLVMEDEPCETSTDPHNEYQIYEQDCQPEPMSQQAPGDDAPQDEEMEERGEQEEEYPGQYSQELLLSQETVSQVGSNSSSAKSQNMDPRFSSAVSECSETSSLELLDDEKRRAYLKKLMSSPEYPALISRQMSDNALNKQQQNRSPGNSDYLNNLHQMFQVSDTNHISAAPDVNSQSDEDLETYQNQQMQADMQEELPNESDETVSYSEDQSSVVSFTNMNSLFGPDPGQANRSNNESAFSFGGFPFGGASNSGSTDFFGGSNLFGDPAPAQNLFGNSAPTQNLFGNSAPALMETSPFSSSTPMQSGSDVFNLNFNNNSDSNSIFKLF